MSKSEKKDLVYVVRKVCHKRQVFEYATAVVSSWEKALSLIHEELVDTDDDSEEHSDPYIQIEVHETIIDAPIGGEGSHGQKWYFDSRGNQFDHYSYNERGIKFDDDENEAEFVGKYAEGDLVRVLPRKVGMGTEVWAGPVAVVLGRARGLRLDVVQSGGDSTEWRNLYIVRYLDEDFGTLCHEDVEERWLEPYTGDLPSKLHFLHLLSDHIKGAHKLQPHVFERINKKQEFLLNVDRFNFQTYDFDPAYDPRENIRECDQE